MTRNSVSKPGNALVRAASISVAGLLLAGTALGQVKVTAGDVEDSRRTDGFFNRLKVELKMSGAALDGAKGLKVIVNRAVDDTGKNLINADRSNQEFREIDTQHSEAREQIDLLNPERRASTVREISGVVEVFSPKKDPRSVVLVTNFQRNIGTPIPNASLRSAGIEVTVWSREMFEARKKAEEERINKEMEEKARKAEQSRNVADAVGLLADTLAAAFGGLFSGFAGMEEHDIAFSVKDPGSKLIAIQFEDPSGKALETGGRMTMGGETRTIIYSFSEKLPADARIRLFVLTPSSTVTAPFTVSNVVLP